MMGMIIPSSSYLIRGPLQSDDLLLCRGIIDIFLILWCGITITRIAGHQGSHLEAAPKLLGSAQPEREVISEDFKIQPNAGTCCPAMPSDASFCGLRATGTSNHLNH